CSVTISEPVGQNNWGVNYPATQMCAVNGSTVDMHCTYSYPLNDNGIDTTVTDRFWLIEGTVDLKTQPKYAGRAEYICDNRKCTLRIRDLTESDSAVYKFRFITNQAGGSYTGQPGVTLTVTDPPNLPSVSVSPSEIVEGSSVTLTCSSDANPAANYTWYKENGLRLLSENTQFVFTSINSSDSGQYNCTAENQLGTSSEYIFINVKYPPRLPSVSVSPSEIVEGSSVTLTCSSDANPAAKYTWYKSDTHLKSIHEEPQFVFRSIKSSDSGQYYCEAGNKLGTSRSESVSIDVKYRPNLPSVSVSPSEIVEGSSVTLTCSSDANPAANYTWYKENGLRLLSENTQFVFTSIKSSDSGQYNCTAENQLGTSSEYIFINVKCE
uniref:B-cell receptor CD22 n=1 Tax=Anabas testudineus TaxID=64144 RepID=A0A3Q1H5M4_ANATE